MSGRANFLLNRKSCLNQTSFTLFFHFGKSEILLKSKIFLKSNVLKSKNYYKEPQLNCTFNSLTRMIHYGVEFFLNVNSNYLAPKLCFQVIFGLFDYKYLFFRKIIMNTGICIKIKKCSYYK